MKIVEADKMYVSEIAELAYTTYLKECSCVSELFKDDYKNVLRKEIEEAVLNCGGVMCIEEGRLLGYLLYSATWKDGDMINYCVPSWGYGADHEKREQILARLFEKLADELCKSGEKVHFSVKLYAHDNEAVKLFSMMQFGIQCEECIRSVDSIVTTENNMYISAFRSQDIINRWAEIWPMLNKLINHLKMSPVFYPCNEFTEEVYRDYLLDEASTLFVAEDSGKIIGIIDANSDGNSFINNDDLTYNVGDVYVSHEYRGKGLAQQLLQYADDYLKGKGVTRLWVEHGTANPNARGFWDKYFKTYTYTMIRDIER